MHSQVLDYSETNIYSDVTINYNFHAEFEVLNYFDISNIGKRCIFG